jgi:bifunctional DNA-binding transcriptional regulator/antitoxin component of YhaV-PrlF toxin-antitoxin module
MSRLTSKYQLTIPRAIADSVGLKPGAEVSWEAVGDAIRLRAETVHEHETRSVTDQLILFDLATERQQHRMHNRVAVPAQDRGWSREDLYEN